MDSLKLASGDNNESVPILPTSPRSNNAEDNKALNSGNLDKEGIGSQCDITPQIIDNNETKLKKRIAQCKNIIESLKFELNEEKAKLGKEKKTDHQVSEPVPKCLSASSAVFMVNETSLNTSSMYSACVESKLSCDESLIEYEKQLEKYQNTLNRAQIEKKNAIRKQMLAKAYKLKLLEVENQCNIELLRVKQSLQCLEPLQMIADKWKTNTDEVYDVNNFELIPSYPELFANSACDSSFFREDFDVKAAIDKSEGRAKDDSTSSDC